MIFARREPGYVLVLEEQCRGRLWSAIPHRVRRRQVTADHGVTLELLRQGLRNGIHWHRAAVPHPAMFETALELAGHIAASAQPARAEHHVVHVVRTGPTLGDDAGTLFVDLHLPVVVQKRGDHRGPDVVGRVEAASCTGWVSIPAWWTSSSTPPGATAASRARSAAASGVRSSAGYCAETRSKDPGGSGASASPACTQRTDAGVPGVPGRSLQRDPGDLERGHVPAAAREPDGVRALAAADVEHPPGGRPATSTTSAPLGRPLHSRSPSR